MMDNNLKKIALIGQPNVGKSSLFNRIAKQRIAIVSEVSGTTRDFRKHEVEILDKSAIIIDTGGIDKTDNEIFINVKAKAIKCAKEADIILFMVDGKRIPEEKDKKLFYELQAMGKNLALIVNKIDNDKELEKLWEFYEFGISQNNLFGISVSHNRGTKSLFEWIAQQLPENKSELDDLTQDEDVSLEELLNPMLDINEQVNNANNTNTNNNDMKVAIIGRVNVGKSSILNALIGEQRSVVSSIAGTTIDPVDETFEYKNKTITFVDTAGLRRRGKIDGIERFALLRTKEMLEKANLALLILDASSPLVDLDEKIAGLVDEYALGTIIVLNKWDENIDEFKKIETLIRDKFKFLYYAPIIAVSAKTKRSIDKLKDELINIYNNYSQRISTSILNQTIEKAIIRHALPSPNGALLKIYYVTQFEIKPPRISLVMNKPRLLHFSYKRYLINFLRKSIDFRGTPIHLVARGKTLNYDTNGKLVEDKKVLKD